jgi:hypothetical protein
MADQNLDTILDCFNISRETFSSVTKEEEKRINLYYEVDVLALEFDQNYKDYWENANVSTPV